VIDKAKVKFDFRGEGLWLGVRAWNVEIIASRAMLI